MNPPRRNGAPRGERLAPHSAAAEQAVLGCILLEPPTLHACLERFAGAQPFYDLRHRTIFSAMALLDMDGVALDLVTLKQRLSDSGHLEQVGGVAYLAALPDATPSSANLAHYLDIVWEKHLGRLLIQQTLEIRDRVVDADGVSEPLLARMKEMQGQFEAELQRGQVNPRYLKGAGDYAEDVWHEFFGGKSATIPGMSLPIEFKLKIRLGECTLVTGDDGSGKSTWLNYCALHLAQQGAPVCIASFEMPPAKTLCMLVCQLLGTRDLPDTEAGRSAFALATSWLNARFRFYSFLGIGDWRDVLDSFRFAALNLGSKVFILDSVMRIGIGDDDYALQGLVAAQFARFCQQHNVHLFLVIHENKGADKGKAKVRGSKLWTANVDNVVKIEINTQKGIKVGELFEELKCEKAQTEPDQASIKEIEKKLETWRVKWDSHVLLLKQRYMGTQQNGSKHFWFDWRCFQYREHYQDQPQNWLDRWKRSKNSEHEQPTQENA